MPLDRKDASSFRMLGCTRTKLLIALAHLFWPEPGEPNWDEVWTDIHGVGPDSPYFVVERLEEKYANFASGVIYFDNHDWEMAWKETRDVICYITHYSSNPVNDIIDWGLEFMNEIYEGVGAIIEQENKAGKPDF